MSLTIRPVDPWDEAELDVLQAQYVEAQRAEVPDARVFSRAESATMLRRPPGPAFYDAFAAFEGGTTPDHMVGQVWVTGSTTDNLHQAWLWAWVPPRHARRGIGSALVRHGEAHLREQRGRRTAVTVTWLGREGDSGYKNFAERLGYTLNNVEVERRQPLPQPQETLSRLEAEAAAHKDGYRLQTIVGPIPDEAAQPFCDAYNQLHVEMPHGELEVEEGRRTPVELKAQDEELLESGRTRVTVLAWDRTDTVVAYTCAATSPPDRDETSVDQWSTLVLPANRGHRLGLAVKCALTRTLQEQFPDRTFVRTQNAEVNAPMVAINEALGFRIHTIDGEFAHSLVE
jgi:GNAT superfamily N-acetyltransferase